VWQGRQVFWGEQCEATISTPESRLCGKRCYCRAKINFNGKKLCVEHAKIVALNHLVGPLPTIFASSQL
jgi:hypothetical protein